MISKKWLGLVLLFFSCSVLAGEPVNLQAAKQQLIQYHDSNAYANDVARVVKNARHYLEKRVNDATFAGKKPAIVLDIDETSLSNYADLAESGFGGTEAAIREAELKGTDPAISPVLGLYRYAKAHHVAVFFITGRFEDERDITAKNLEVAGYTNWDGLTLKPAIYRGKSASIYKAAARKQLVEQGYDIILNMGDQQSDLAGGYSDKSFKLPNSFYFIG